MMYSEFIAGTGCKENEHNYEVYKNLEIMYMNSDMTKEQIYEYGKKLVDNSKTEEEIRFENKIKEQIAQHKDAVKVYKKQIEIEKEFFGNDNKAYLRTLRQMVLYHSSRIKELKWVLSN